MRRSEWGCQEEESEKKLDLRTVNMDIAIYALVQVQSGGKLILKKVTTFSQRICCFLFSPNQYYFVTFLFPEFLTFNSIISGCTKTPVSTFSFFFFFKLINHHIIAGRSPRIQQK